MTETTLRKTIYLQTSCEVVWNYLTQPDKLAIWFHAPKTALTEGEEYSLYGAESGNIVCWGQVCVARAPEYLEYTFALKQMGETNSTVRWTLEAVEGGTRLSLEHTGLPQGLDAFDLTLALDKGWEEHMASMRADIHENTN